MRYSKQRYAVLQALQGTKTHPDASWIYTQVRKQLPQISLGTVYRNLQELCLTGLAKRVSCVGASERFDADVSQHPHFVCTRCGQVIDVDGQNVVCNCNVGDVISCEVVLYGICNQCK